MSTRGHIAIKNGEDTLTYIYCGHDAYPSEVGRILLTTYNTLDKIRGLIDRGDMSSIDVTLDKCDPYADTFEEYPYKVARSLPELTNFGKYIDYTYIFDDGKWFMGAWDYGEYIELTQKIVDGDS